MTQKNDKIVDLKIILGDILVKKSGKIMVVVGSVMHKDGEMRQVIFENSCSECDKAGIKTLPGIEWYDGTVTPDRKKWKASYSHPWLLVRS